MQQLKLGYMPVKDVINAINKHRLSNKGSWYQVEVVFPMYTYRLKCYNTWAQIGRKIYTDTGVVLYNDSSSMDISVGEFKDYLKGLIIEE